LKCKTQGFTKEEVIARSLLTAKAEEAARQGHSIEAMAAGGSSSGSSSSGLNGALLPPPAVVEEVPSDSSD